MPSVALRLRADGDGDGFADIWRSEDDAFASIANYLRDAGWKPNMLWGVPGARPGGFNRAAVRNPAGGAALPARSTPATAGRMTMARMAGAGRRPGRPVAARQ